MLLQHVVSIFAGNKLKLYSLILYYIYLSTNILVGKRNISKSGFCISGQTIKDAAKLIENSTSMVDDTIIINIGSVDLLHGHDLIDMKHDFIRLLNAFKARQIIPVITTLAPLANISHIPRQRKTWQLFNNFLQKHYAYNLINIETCFVTQKGQTMYDCYQP